MTVAVIIVAVELATIAYIRHRYMDTPFLQAAIQAMVGRPAGFSDGLFDRKFVEAYFTGTRLTLLIAELALVLARDR